MTAPNLAARLLAMAAEAEALAEQATPGPWDVADHREFWEGGMIRDEAGYSVCVFLNGWDQTIHNRAFIAASRTLVPALAAALGACVRALEFYGDEDNWNWNGSLDDATGVQDSDMGIHARTVLDHAAAAMEGGDA